MTKNAAKIKAGIRSLAGKPYEIISGQVMAGSVDTSEYTMSVQPTDDSLPIEGVMLSTIINNGDGLILVPEDGSDVVIASIDGPGEWCLIKVSQLTKVLVTIGNVQYEMDATQVSVKNGSVLFNISNSVFKMNTASESLFQLLKDCFTYLTALTVSTSTGPSSVPINVADFSSLLTRLNNLLAS